MNLSYFELLSPDPVYIQNVGGILSPKLKDISFIGINTYQYYLTFISMDLKAYFSMTGQKEQFALCKKALEIMKKIQKGKEKMELLSFVKSTLSSCYVPVPESLIIENV